MGTRIKFYHAKKDYKCHNRQVSKLKLLASLGLPLVGNRLDGLLDSLLVTEELHGDNGL